MSRSTGAQTPTRATGAVMDRLCRLRSRAAGAVLALMGLIVLTAHSAVAGPTERMQAKRMHDRLVGVPPSEAVLSSMEASIVANDPIAAAYTAMNDPIFYTSALKNFAAPWTNVPRSVFVDLNDY